MPIKSNTITLSNMYGEETKHPPQWTQPDQCCERSVMSGWIYSVSNVLNACCIFLCSPYSENAKAKDSTPTTPTPAPAPTPTPNVEEACKYNYYNVSRWLGVARKKHCDVFHTWSLQVFCDKYYKY